MKYESPVVTNKEGTLDCATCGSRHYGLVRWLKLNDFGICARCYSKMPDAQRAILENRQPQTVYKPPGFTFPFLMLWTFLMQAVGYAIATWDTWKGIFK